MWDQHRWQVVAEGRRRPSERDRRRERRDHVLRRRSARGDTTMTTVKRRDREEGDPLAKPSKLVVVGERTPAVGDGAGATRGGGGSSD